MYKIALSNLNELYKAISAECPLYLPIKKAGEVNYAFYEEGAEVSLNTLRTVKSPKDCFFPQSEDLVKFKVDGQKIEVIDMAKVGTINGKVFRIEKQRPFEDNNLATIQTVITCVKE
jgi:hypothetical protein